MKTNKNFPYCKFCRDWKPLKNGQVHQIGDVKCKFYKPTHFDNEITGNFYPRTPMPRRKKVLITLAVLLVAYLTFDWFFPEVVTETLAAVVMLFR